MALRAMVDVPRPAHRPLRSRSPGGAVHYVAAGNFPQGAARLTLLRLKVLGLETLEYGLVLRVIDLIEVTVRAAFNGAPLFGRVGSSK